MFKIYKFQIIFVLSFIFSFFIFSKSLAGYLTIPLNSFQVNSLFDHSLPNLTADGVFVRHDGSQWTSNITIGSCTPGSNCYDGHNGVDLDAIIGTDVLSAGAGIIQEATFNSCAGFYIRIWHPTVGYSTRYLHLSSPFIVSSGSVDRYDHIAESGDSGDPTCIMGAHLHFDVRNAQVGGQVMDPYGWSPVPGAPVQNDPWSYNQGYLWTTNPPSLNVPPVVSPPLQNFTPVSGTISQNTTWIAGNVYVINGTVTVNSGVTLTVEPGTIVKFNSSTSSISVFGSLLAQGTAGQNIYFTSIHDDSVGGDTNNNSNGTSPAQSDFTGIRFFSNSVGILDHISLTYGGNQLYGVLSNSGGTINIYNSHFSKNDPSIYQSSGSLGIGSSTIDNNPFYCGFFSICYGLKIDGGSLNLVGNTLLYNKTFIDARVNFTASGNQILGGLLGYMLSGTIYQNTSWSPQDYPLVISAISILPGITLNIQAGMVMKFVELLGGLSVYGILNVQGGQDNQVYFTSLYDNSVGGDTTNSGQPPSAGDWNSIRFFAGSSGTIENATIRYAGCYACQFYGLTSYGGVSNAGGNLNITDSKISNNYLYGIYHNGGTSAISGSSISNNTQYGINNTTLTSLNAQNNWWGTPTGPYHSTLNPNGGGNQISNNVNFSPWLAADPDEPPPIELP